MAGGPEFWGIGLGDWATWLGAFGSISAAFAAVFAARKAIELARIPVLQAKIDRRETAMAFAASILEEMREVADVGRDLELGARVHFGKSLGHGRRFLHRLDFDPMLATARAIPFVNCFDRAEGAAIVAVIAAKGALDTRIAALGKLEDDVQAGDGTREILLARMERCARLLVEAAERAADAMRHYTTKYDHG
jgi:hypothetical protein